MPEPLGDPLEALREQIDATRRAAERLTGHAQRARAAAVPPMGWASPQDHINRVAEVQQLAALLDAVGGLIPSELEAQFRDVVRQVLLLVRALLDWWVARLEPATPSASAPDPGGPEIQDIPIS